MNITNVQKEEIRAKLTQYLTLFPSQNRAANSLKNVSSSTITQILRGNWGSVSDEMWRNISAQIDTAEESGWQTVETGPFAVITETLEDAQRNSIVYAVVLGAGKGKTSTTKAYEAKHKKLAKNVFRLVCAGFWNKKRFLQELMRAMGLQNFGYSLGEMMDKITAHLKRTDHPLLILDEVDKLSDEILYFFITLYNEFEDRCGMVLFGTSYFQKRIERGVEINKRGYEEIYSRFCRKFIQVPENTEDDLRRICFANGITDELTVTEIVNESEGDIRRLKRKVHAAKEKMSA